MDTISDKVLKLYKEKMADADLYKTLFLDRNQLYGSLINLMKKLGETSITITEAEFKETAKLMLTFTPSEDEKGLTLSLSDYVEEAVDESQN